MFSLWVWVSSHFIHGKNPHRKDIKRTFKPWINNHSDLKMNITLRGFSVVYESETNHRISYNSNHCVLQNVLCQRFAKAYSESYQRHILMHCRSCLRFESHCESLYKCQNVSTIVAVALFTDLCGFESVGKCAKDSTRFAIIRRDSQWFVEHKNP